MAPHGSDGGGPPKPRDPGVAELVRELKGIRKEMLGLESRVDLEQFGERKKSACNLLHYIALRGEDLRDLQDRLAVMGLSSLGRSESHVLYNLDAVLGILEDLAGEGTSAPPGNNEVTPLQGKQLLETNAEELFGPMGEGRSTRIMVTMPSEAAADYSLVRDLVEAGMDCMRINCAHDDAAAWLSMIENLRNAEKEVGRKCKVLMDIAGPKVRTGPLEPGPQVLRLRPQRDSFGRMVAPARVTLAGKGATKHADGGDLPTLIVQDEWLQELEDGCKIGLTDSRGKKRTMTATVRRGRPVTAEARKTTYIDPTVELTVEKDSLRYSSYVLNVPYTEAPIVLKKGDTLVITADEEPGRPASKDEPARISCTLPSALGAVKAGQTVWLDDGKIGGVVRGASESELLVEITDAAEGGAKLRADKGINLPLTKLDLPPLTPKDLEDLQFIVDHADIVGYSFVHDPKDVQILRAELERLGKEEMGVILKIETRNAFESLPSLLLESLRGPGSGVMIARGDLAVECGYERLAEVQEEMLWMCEAAHMPTVWATQVLEGLAKSGIPSRAEVTDAAMGERSECVMLNKGPHILEALRALDNILRRMQAHQVKKTSMMRKLDIAASFSQNIKAERDRRAGPARRSRGAP